MYFPINVTVSRYPTLLIFLTLKNRPIRWRTLSMVLWRLDPIPGRGFPYGASRSHSDTPPSVGLLRTSDQPGAKTST